MKSPWSERYLKDESILVSFNGVAAYTLRRDSSLGLMWELRKIGSEVVIESHQSRSVIFEGMESGKLV